MTATANDLRRRLKARRVPPPAVARAIRVTSGATQAEVAAILGVHRVSVARWEIGLRRPRGQLAEAYAQVLRKLQEA